MLGSDIKLISKLVLGMGATITRTCDLWYLFADQAEGGGESGKTTSHVRRAVAWKKENRLNELLDLGEEISQVLKA